MPRFLSCPHGHQWEQADDAGAGGDSLACPVCGVDLRAARTAGSASRSDTATLLQGTVLPRDRFSAAHEQAPPALPDFEILEELGRGGMGIVYRARQLRDQQIVAIKVIRKDR